MNRFNLTFSGVISAGRNQQRAKARFAEIFDITDSTRLEQFFSGDTIVLRRNLDRRESTEYFSRMRRAGLEAELVQADAFETSAGVHRREKLSTAAPSPNESPPQTSGNSQRHELAAKKKRKRKEATIARKQKRIEAKRAQREAESRQASEESSGENSAVSNAREAHETPQPENRVQKPAPASSSTGGLIRPSSKAADKPRPIRSQLRPRNDTGDTAKGRREQNRVNPYRLNAFRNSPQVRLRASAAGAELRRGLITAGIALALLLVLAGNFIAQRAQPLPSGPAAIAATSNGKLYILVGNQLLQHDRAGVPEQSISLTDWGIGRSGNFLLALPDDSLLLQAQSEESHDPLQVWQCHPSSGQCNALPGDYASLQVDAATYHPHSGDLILADMAESIARRVNSQGDIVAQAPLELPARPVLHLDTGLLLINSAVAPALSVFRIEPDAFGRQIDELLLLPAPALAAGQTVVVDFLPQGENWWAALRNPEDGTTGGYIFDRHWKHVGDFSWPEGYDDATLVGWKDKILLSSPQQQEIRRYNSAGNPEAVFTSPLLEAQIENAQSARAWRALAWKLAFLGCATVLVLGALYAALHYLRQRVYSNQKAQGAEPLDSELDKVKWFEAEPRRSQHLRRTTYAGLLAGGGLVLITVAFGAPLLVLLALLIALAGVTAALLILERSHIDHIGLLGGKFVLVDHLERYHSGATSRVRQRGPFLYIDDIIVFTGAALLPVLSPLALEELRSLKLETMPRASWPEVLVRLQESRHPLARAGLVLALALGLSVLCVLLS